ncbi:hypothetical protein JW979_03580 [bacterium]|nr:hypothetical protein [candidate division CSSED10-310 bacterium]
MNRQASKNEDGYTWRVHLAADRPIRSVIGLMSVGFVLGIIYQVTEEMFFCAIALGVFMITLAPFYRQITYTIDGNGITQRGLVLHKTLPWREVSRYSVSQTGVFVSAKSKRFWFDTRGIFLMFKNNREAVLARLEKELAKV